jgi:hypothetical protein
MMAANGGREQWALAVVIAEVQIALLAHWPAGVLPWRPEEMAQALISSTRALLA